MVDIAGSGGGLVGFGFFSIGDFGVFLVKVGVRFGVVVSGFGLFILRAREALKRVFGFIAVLLFFFAVGAIAFTADVAPFFDKALP